MKLKLLLALCYATILLAIVGENLFIEIIGAVVAAAIITGVFHLYEYSKSLERMVKMVQERTGFSLGE